MRRTMTLRGGICGPIWQPGFTCGKPLNKRLTRVKARDVSNVRRSLYDMLADVLNDGDFRSARLTADTFIEIIDTRGSIARSHTSRRIIDVVDLPSIADLVDSDTYLPDFD